MCTQADIFLNCVAWTLHTSQRALQERLNLSMPTSLTSDLRSSIFTPLIIPLNILRFNNVISQFMFYLTL